MIKNIINTRWMVIVIMAIVTVIGGVTIVQAWTDNTLTPIGGSLLGPINTGEKAQTKTGDLTLGNDISVNQISNTDGNVTMTGGLKLNKNTNNCNLRLNGSGVIECAGISADVTAPYDCNGTGGGDGGYCPITEATESYQCFLTKIEAWGTNIDGYDCEVYYDSGKGYWRIHYWGDDISGISCQAICIK